MRADDLLPIPLDKSRNQMKRIKLSVAAIITLSAFLCGCKMAEPNFDENYSAYGGVIQRPDTTVERVNSVLDVPTATPESATN